MYAMKWRMVKLLEPMIECDNLVKIYKTKDIEVMALQGLDMKVDTGEFIAVIGNSGSGKSTFLNMIGGLDRPSAGSLSVNGQNLFKMTEKELVNYKQSTVGFVWQNNARNLFPYLTAIENIQVPMLFTDKKKTHEKALELLELVGMSHRKDSKLNQLSGGEQQRIAIAIALANDPKLLLADEPTGAVDAKTADYIFNVFKKLNEEKGMTIVIVTHDLNLSKRVKRVILIRDGKTSTERIIKHNLLDDLKNVGSLEDDNKHDEFAILDRAGRLQINKEYLEALGITGNKVKIALVNGKIEISPPDEEKK